MLAVMVVLPDPPTTTPLGRAVTEEVAALGGPARKETEACRVRPPAVAVTVFSSALGERRVAEKVPSSAVVPVVLEKVFWLQVEESVTARPGMGLPCASRIVTER